MGRALRNTNPVELEIGMGKGTFLTEQAKARPETNFFGIEWARWFWRYASDRLRRNGCTNARTVRAEASFFLSEFVPAESLAVVHIYFPDPWPKERHKKRRLIQDKFLPRPPRAAAGGRLQVVTDHKGYWEENIEPAVGNAAGFTVVDYNRPAPPATGNSSAPTSSGNTPARAGRSTRSPRSRSRVGTAHLTPRTGTRCWAMPTLRKTLHRRQNHPPTSTCAPWPLSPSTPA
jgi:tRNA (guanine-N(7)-)-methyltransferase